LPALATHERHDVALAVDTFLWLQNALESHLQSAHALQLCRICLMHKKVFLSEQQRFKPAALKQHMVEGKFQ
jgi:hypothetical protein